MGMETKELRRVFILRDGQEVEGSFGDVKEGDVFRMIEHSGEPIVHRPDFKGLCWYRAAKDPYPDREKPGQRVIKAYVLGRNPNTPVPKDDEQGAA